MNDGLNQIKQDISGHVFSIYIQACGMLSSEDREYLVIPNLWGMKEITYPDAHVCSLTHTLTVCLHTHTAHMARKYLHLVNL